MYEESMTTKKDKAGKLWTIIHSFFTYGETEALQLFRFL